MYVTQLYLWKVIVQYSKSLWMKIYDIVLNKSPEETLTLIML